MRRAGIGLDLAVALAALAAGLAAGCQPYRVEYHRRPDFHRKAAGGALPNRVTLPDGTVIVYESEHGPDGLAGADGEGANLFQPREETEDGQIILRAILPEHVVVNTLWCIQQERYDLLWDQMLSEHTRLEYENIGQGSEEFSQFFARHREELAMMLSRMVLGLAGDQVLIDPRGQGVIRLKLRASIASQFRFKSVYVINEGLGLKLLLIK